MKLNVSAFEATNDAFTVAEKPGVRVWERGAGAGAGAGAVRIVVKSAKDDDLFAGHEHEILWLGGRIVDEGGAGADAALLKGKAGPRVEGMCVHRDAMNKGQ